MGAQAADIAARRRTNPASLRRLVGGDLNWITTKALEKVRERRYASVAEFAADVQRHLEHRPVLASPPSRLYQFRNFLRRHRPAVFGTADRLKTPSLALPDSPRISTPASKAVIVLGDFANTTGDPAFDGTLRQIMAVELRQSERLFSKACVGRVSLEVAWLFPDIHSCE